MTDPVASFVIPTKNEAASLPETLERIRAQRTTRPYEIIVVDGDSDDATADIAARYDATLVEQSGTGIGDARHRGAERARGEWLAFVDADTGVRPEYLGSMLDLCARRG